MNVVTCEFLHETNTFNTRPTTIQCFQDRFTFYGYDDCVAQRGDMNTELAGFLDCQKSYGWNRLHHILSAHAEPSGVVTTEAFEHFAGKISQGIDSALAVCGGRIDGVLLALHGAMVTEQFEDGEGELLRRVRIQVGPAVPIAATLDLHANCTEAMCSLADALVSFKTYPHVDMRQCARHAGRVLDAAMRGAARPRMLRAHRPMLEEANGGRTDVGAMLWRLQRMAEYEGSAAGCLAVSINAGFPTDILDAGPTVLVCYDSMGDEESVRCHWAFAESVADDIWQRREGVVNIFLSVEEACQQAAALVSSTGSSSGGKPVVIADYSDNPGAGAYGDGTNLLRCLLSTYGSDAAGSLGSAAFAPMYDPELCGHIHEHCCQGQVLRDARLGGKCDPQHGGGPLVIRECVVALISDGRYTASGPMYGGLSLSFGRSVVLSLLGGRISVLVVSECEQILDHSQFESFGISVGAQHIIGLKSMQHFRAAFEPSSRAVLVCDSGAIATPDLRKLHFSRVRRPVYPLDDFDS